MYKLYIQHYRKLKRMTQDELAEKCNLNRSYISKIERDNSIRTHSPRLTTIENIALELKVCPNSILRYMCQSCTINKDCKKKEHAKDYNLADEDYNYYI